MAFWMLLAQDACPYLVAMESDMNDVAATQKRSVGFLLGIGILFIPIIFAWFLLRKGHSVLARIIGFAWLAVGVLVMLAAPSAPRVDHAPSVAATSQASTPAPAPAAPIPAYLSAQVAASYDENTVAADMKFKGKRVKVSGKVTDINTDFMGNPYLVLAGNNPYLGPQFKFSKSDVEAMAAVKKGATVHVICTGLGDIAKTPMFDDCEMAN
ncbi:OB-fold protein [Pseudomonas mohnii]